MCPLDFGSTTNSSSSGTRRLSARRPVERAILDADLIAPPVGSHDRAIVEEPGDRLGIECGRHDDQDQVGADLPANFPQKRQREVAVQVALVKFVKHDGADGFKERIIEELTGEDALGQEPKRRMGREPLFEADLVADLFPRFQPCSVGDPRRRGPRAATRRG